ELRQRITGAWRTGSELVANRFAVANLLVAQRTTPEKYLFLSFLRRFNIES
ncbi:hypothetical protein L195_g064749, partial [Trifolium pratense]